MGDSLSYLGMVFSLEYGSGEVDLSLAQKVRSYLSGSYGENQNQFDYNFLMYR